MGSFKARAHESAAGSRPAGMLDRGTFRADQVLASEFRAATFRPDPHGAMLTKQGEVPAGGRRRY